MKWFEYIIIIVAVFLVVFPIVSHFVKKKKGTLKCECGHLQSECIGNCSKCSLTKNDCSNKKQRPTYVLHVEGMKCGMCESHINDLIRNNFNVVKVNSSKDKNQVIIVSKELLNETKIKEVIKNAGYDVTSIYLR